MIEISFEESLPPFEVEFNEGMEGGAHYNFGDGLKFDTDTNTLSVDTAEGITENDPRPISSQTLWEELAGVEEILRSI